MDYGNILEIESKFIFDPRETVKHLYQIKFNTCSQKNSVMLSILDNSITSEPS